MAKLIQYCTQASLYDGPFGPDVGWAAAGMGYILKTAEGRLIVIDGGNKEDAAPLFELLTACAGTETPEIALWIITHPHLDHYGALLMLFSEPQFAGKLRIHELMYDFPGEFHGGGNELGINDLYHVLVVSGADHHIPRTDEKFCVDELKFHLLYTPDDCSILNNANQLSLIFTVTGPQKKLMITGDAYERNLQIVLWRYPNGLKCDILQLPHHGLCDTGHLEFYRQADAETVLIPISVAGNRTMRSGIYGDDPAANRFAEENAQTVYKAFEGTAELEL